MTDPTSAYAPSKVYDHSGNAYWCEIQFVSPTRSRVRLMRSWLGFRPDVIWSSRRLPHDKAQAKADRAMQKLAKRHEGWVDAHGRDTCDDAGRPLSTYTCDYHQGYEDGLDAADMGVSAEHGATPVSDLLSVLVAAEHDLAGMPDEMHVRATRDALASVRTALTIVENMEAQA